MTSEEDYEIRFVSKEEFMLLNASSRNKIRRRKIWLPRWVRKSAYFQKYLGEKRG